jgi:hypothetical protein
MNAPTTIREFSPALAGEIAEMVLIRGDLSALTHQERARYYTRICESLGLNPMTKPFEYLTLNGKLVLYALKAATDQLRKLHGVSVAIVSHEIAGDLLTVHVKAHDKDGRDKDGREDEDFGVVVLPDKAEARANAILKAVTKAKRRVTLSICGLGFLDETEVEDIPAVAKQESVAPAAANVEPPSPENIAPAKLPARIQRNLDRLKPKPDGIAERAMAARNGQAFTKSAAAGHIVDKRYEDVIRYERAAEAAKALNRRLHPMNDELPAHSAPPKIDTTERDGVPAFLDRRAKKAEPSYLDLVGGER